MMKREKPLSGQKILITRSEEQALPFVREIEKKGGEALVIPLLSFRLPDDTSNVRQAIHQVDDFQWIVFTSQNAVRFFIQLMNEEKLPISRLQACKIAAIGRKTYHLLKDLGVKVDFYPSEFVGEQFVTEFKTQTDRSDRVFIPHGNLSRSTIKDSLREFGLDVHDVILYETYFDPKHQTKLREVMDQHIDILTFTSPSTVHFFFKIVGEDFSLNDRYTACIGPITANALKEYGISANIIAKEYTIDGLVDSIESFIQKEE
ncbi:uroporphyrinogen-III synthase [Pseudalkalibacillus berkeleyi]|uniref:Uroporphyrinogen-III synthase n=1 Tax=Pseudalkalibacillus berkeleyi TaxID=1069813 RepID=A0ABS9H2C7_9BACL|nr:uroporphyrinogen-III synthase [Pseudalkalibacillus berkeleyi]MCF6138120.1 uroporphyrinogen-III synthase [Pseudalkalibacillus berkeleyi]